MNRICDNFSICVYVVQRLEMVTTMTTTTTNPWDGYSIGAHSAPSVAGIHLGSFNIIIQLSSIGLAAFHALLPTHLWLIEMQFKNDNYNNQITGHKIFASRFLMDHRLLFAHHTTIDTQPAKTTIATTMPKPPLLPLLFYHYHYHYHFHCRRRRYYPNICWLDQTE